MKRSILACLFVCLLSIPFSNRVRSAQIPPDVLTGTWSGQLNSGSESKAMSFRFDVSPKGAKMMFLDIPELKFHNLGPIAIKPDGDNFKGSGFELRVTADKAISGSWSFDGNDLTFDLQPGPLIDLPAAKPLEGRTAEPLWTFKTAGAIWSSPVLADNVVYFGSDDGNLYSVSANNGKQVWQFKTDGKIMGRPTVDSSFVYALSDDGFLYKLDRRNAKTPLEV